MTEAIAAFIADPVRSVQSQLSRRDAWWVVALYVLLVLAVIYVVAMTIWCVTRGHGSFTGSYSWKNLLEFYVSCWW